jgi:YidC/Oxa1 family membrane protein insertase
MNNESRNFILVVVIWLSILAGYHFFYEKPRLEKAVQEKAKVEELKKETTPVVVEESPMAQSREQALNLVPRVSIETPNLHGSLSLVGGRLDDLTLAQYHETIDNRSPEITLLSPSTTTDPYYAEFGWVATNKDIKVPTAETVWQVTEGTKLTPNTPITLQWDNGQGLVFEREFSVDENFMFTIQQKVKNNTAVPVALHPYGLISRGGTPPVSNYFILYEGPIGYIGSKLKEHSYKDLNADKKVEYTSLGGWLGITDKYWLTALIPDQKHEVKASFSSLNLQKDHRYQTDFLGTVSVVEGGTQVNHMTHFFAGAKSVELLDAYEEVLGVPHFDLAVDFGWFYFITKPLFHALKFFHKLIGNFGLGILLLTVLIRLAFFPLANKSYRSMSRMRALQPEMAKIKELYADDKVRVQQEIMALYKKHQVNPVSGCLPILLQIPVFFALYKVLFVTIEMRHAPFYGWIHDLSAPDPTTIFNLFGLIPWDPPSFLMLGALPIMMGITMFLQQRLNPQTMDPAQEKIFMFMPIIFTYLLAQFPAGLVLYWTWSNIIAILQQWSIMRLSSKGPLKGNAKPAAISRKK